MRKVYIKVEVRLIVNMDDGIQVSDLIENMDYDMTSQTEGADITETEIRDYEVMDSK